MVRGEKSMVDREYAKREEIRGGGSWSSFGRQREGKEKFDDEISDDYGRMMTMEFQGERKRFMT